MARKSNWDRIRKQKSTDTVKYRDVYEDQQLERSSIKDKETMLTRNILNAFICILVFFILWFLISGIEMVTSRFGGNNLKVNQAPDNMWIHVNEYYVNNSDSSDKITPEEYEAALKAFEENPIETMEEPVKPENPADVWVNKSDYYEYALDSSKTITVEEYRQLEENYSSDVEAYEEQKAAYDDYLKASVSPKDKYSWQRSHYRNRLNFEEYILEEDYDARLADYQKKLAAGKIKDKDKNIPYQPVSPADLYRIYDEEGNIIDNYFDMTPAQKAERPVGVIRNVLDGSTLTVEEFDEKVATYNTELKKFKEDYDNYMNKYYPEEEDGKMVFRVGPTKKKVMICTILSGLLFGFLYILFRKNLDAANLLSDTSDINQYHNDQHIALPEEVQRNYDWFPDVGAHSAVQVSSMISHMALLNKGLKKIDVATRADKDIKDEDGNIEYFKGEILEDENGNYITSTEPMIDDKFMEDLFDASGAPKDKNVRHRYDATKIPYNPDGSNRDKLGKFETVADLINEDWEFPIYEPQRPAGAYIVDTAPVNTMVLAITRAGKGQTVIEPTIDMWMREKRPNNMVINDPKGELLVKNYVRATVRGIQVVQFNLINAMKTDIYNRAPRSIMKSYSAILY